MAQTSEMFRELGTDVFGASDRFDKSIQWDSYSFNANTAVYDNVDFNRMAVFPQWYFSAKWGQARKINVLELRDLAKSPWIQMVQNIIWKNIIALPLEFPNNDPEDNNSYQIQKNKVKDFLEHCGPNGESWNDYTNDLITDLGEIDAGVIVKVFTRGSYEKKLVPIYDGHGNYYGKEPRWTLKPFGQRKLQYIQVVDSSTFLKTVDLHKVIQAYYQYSFLNPMAAPLFFQPDEICYLMMNRKSYDIYGYSPVQAIEQIIQVMMNATRWNKDFFINNLIPDMLIGMPNANPESMKKFKNEWIKQAQGKAHKTIFHNTDFNVSQLAVSPKEMEWLNGQKWYQWAIFGVYGISPAEAGYYEGLSQGNQEGQERTTVKNGVKPFYMKLESALNYDLIREILQVDKPKFRANYNPRDHVEERIEHDQNMAQIDRDIITINEFRKSRGLKDVEWGNKPMSMFYMDQNSNSQNNNQNDDQTLNSEEAQTPIPETPKKYVKFTKAFEMYMSKGD